MKYEKCKEKKIFQSLDACSKFFTTSIKQFPNIPYCIHKNYQRYLRQKSQRTPFDLPIQPGNIFSRTSFQWKSTNPRRPISILIIIHGQCIRRLESILGRDYQPIILICSWVEAIGHRLFRVEISSPFAILYSANPPPSSSRRWA